MSFSFLQIVYTFPIYFYIINTIFTDLLLQHIWEQYMQHQPQMQNYQDLVEKIKLTPRIWNPAVDLTSFVKHLTWILGLPINLIGLKKTQTQHKEIFQCNHMGHCFLPYYKFQNPYIRFCQKRQKNDSQLNFLEYKSKYYAISSTSCQPLLINQLPNFNFYFQSQPVTLHDIDSILNHKHVEKPFSIALYSTTTYVRSTHIKTISKHVIGNLQNNSEHILHLFLSPHLHGYGYDIYVLDLSSTGNIIFNRKNVFSNTHLTEGKYDFKSHSRPNKDMLNQNHCICEHPDTERYHTPNRKSFKPLGNFLNFYTCVKNISYIYIFIFFSAVVSNQKNFLYENLGKTTYNH